MIVRDEHDVERRQRPRARRPAAPRRDDAPRCARDQIGIGDDELAAEAQHAGRVADPGQRRRRRRRASAGRARAPACTKLGIVVLDAAAGERVDHAPAEDVAGAARRLGRAIVEAPHSSARRGRAARARRHALGDPAVAADDRAAADHRLAAEDGGVGVDDDVVLDGRVALGGGERGAPRPSAATARRASRPGRCARACR